MWLGICAIFHTLNTGYLKKRRFNGMTLGLGHKNPYAEAYGFQFGVADGARTHDNRNHNPGLYQLSYSHHKTFMARPTGIEPVTARLEGGCSIRLSYGRINFFGLCFLSGIWSGRWDSNSRPSAPKADALTRLRYAPHERAEYTGSLKERQDTRRRFFTGFYFYKRFSATPCFSGCLNTLWQRSKAARRRRFN